jgi:hypothetical protein
MSTRTYLEKLDLDQLTARERELEDRLDHVKAFAQCFNSLEAKRIIEIIDGRH